MESRALKQRLVIPHLEGYKPQRGQPLTCPREPGTASLHGLQRVAGTYQTSHERQRKKVPPEPWG